MTIDLGELAGNIIVPDTRVTVPPKDAAVVTACLIKSVVPTNIKLSQRLLDLLLGSILFLILSPLFIALIVGIKMDTPGPAIFYQRRLGRYGRGFKCYKFRTMFQDNQAILEKHLHDNPTVREDWDKFAKLRGNDPRVTRSGKWLRCWSLDELPQLLNVLKGDMSLVGPRPYLPRERSEMQSKDGVILSVLPGITGLWQVSGRNDIEFTGRLQLDCWYVLNRSLRLDISILGRTLPVILSKKGAY